MTELHISIAGLSTLLGQNFLEIALQQPEITVQSLHDALGYTGHSSLSEICDWHVSGDVLRRAALLPLLAAEAPAEAPILISFLPDSVGEHIESQHLTRGTRVITHCEYARLTAPLYMPGVKEIEGERQLLATPNCTTAICATPLAQLQREFGVTRAVITTLQAISGTDLPGLPASAIHDQVQGHLPSEAEALSKELSILFDAQFPVDTFATRVPVWRGHTLTMALDLKERPKLDSVRAALSGSPEIAFQDTKMQRIRYPNTAMLTRILSLRQTDRGVLLVLQGDNLEAATAGVMLKVLKRLQL